MSLSDLPRVYGCGCRRPRKCAECDPSLSNRHVRIRHSYSSGEIARQLFEDALADAQRRAQRVSAVKCGCRKPRMCPKCDPIMKMLRERIDKINERAPKFCWCNGVAALKWEIHQKAVRQYGSDCPEHDPGNPHGIRWNDDGTPAWDPWERPFRMPGNSQGIER